MMSIARRASGLAVARVGSVGDVFPASGEAAELRLSAEPLLDELGRLQGVAVADRRTGAQVSLSWKDLAELPLWPYSPAPAQMWQHLQDLTAVLLVRLDFDAVAEDGVVYLKLWVTFAAGNRGVKKALQLSLRSLYRWVADLNPAVNQVSSSSSSSSSAAAAPCSHSDDQQQAEAEQANRSLARLFSSNTGAERRGATLGDVYKSLKKPTFHYYPCDPLEYADSSFSYNFPDEVLTQILTCLDAHSLHQVSCSCKLLRNASVGVIPGLKLRLFEHQFTSVWWMLRRETSPEATPHPTLRRLVAEDGSTTWVNLLDGSVQAAPDLHTEARGGLLCDEPGLGKTITCLATVLRTLGSVSSEASNSAQPVTPYGLRSAHNRRRSVKLERTVRSHGTLIIVPDALLDHWKTQINMHITPSVLRGVFFDEHPKTPLPDAATLKDFSLVVTTYRRLTSEWLYGRPTCALEERIPITFSEEFQLGGRRRSHEEIMEARGLLSEEQRLSPLLQVFWFRLVVDEGHALARDAVTHAIAMASCIEAERRWVMTGTPTPSTSGKEYRHLWHLLKFLRQPPFLSAEGERVWKDMVQVPHEQKLLDLDDQTASIASDTVVAQRFSWPVQSILQRIMIRHNKESIAEIPKPIRRLTFLRMSAAERESYNVLVSLAKNNLVVTGLDYKTPGAQHLDSHLNPRNRKFATEAMANIRVACCGGGHSGIFLKDHGLHETIAYMRHRLGLPDPFVNKVLEYIRRAEAGLTSDCEWCGIPLGLLIVTPCAHLYCPECTERMGDYCEICRQHFDWNDLQRLQPGFESRDYQFEKPNEDAQAAAAAAAAQAAALERRYSHEGLAFAAYIVPPPPGDNLEPVDAFYLPAKSSSSTSASLGAAAAASASMTATPAIGAAPQPDNGDISTKARYVICKIQEIQREAAERNALLDRRAAAMRSLGGGATTAGVRFAGGSNAAPAGRRLKLSNLASYGALASIHDGGAQFDGAQAPPVKVIVFSQFFEFLDRVAVDLMQAGIKFERFWGKKRAHALKRFRILNDVRVLLLTKEGSHGLDLSFVTHIFLMDSIEDRALEEQVISRAYRMGSKQSVVVDQLVMAGTIEDDVVLLAHRNDRLYSKLALEVDRNRARLRGEEGKFDEDASSSTGTSCSQADESVELSESSTSRSAKERQVARLHFLLNTLSLARDRPLRIPPSTRQFAHGRWSDELLRNLVDQNSP